MRELAGAVVLLVGLLLGGSAWAEAEPNSIVEVYLKGLVAGDTIGAFATLMTHSRIDYLKPRAATLLRGQTQEAISLYGTPSGYERVSRKPYGSSIVRLIYITKHSDVALVWNFYFYRAANEWQLINFDFNDLFKKLE